MREEQLLIYKGTLSVIKIYMLEFIIKNLLLILEIVYLNYYVSQLRTNFYLAFNFRYLPLWTVKNGSPEFVASL